VAITDDTRQQAEDHQSDEHHTHAVSARYDTLAKRIIVCLDSGLELAIPHALVEGLNDATQEALAEIEISPSGLGLHWPQLDADIYIPALLAGQFGSQQWMALLQRAAGGRSDSNPTTGSHGCSRLDPMAPRTQLESLKKTVEDTDQYRNLEETVAQLLSGRQGIRADELIRQGVPLAALDRLAQHGMDLYQLGIITPQTLSRRRARGKPLTRDEGDRLYRVARIILLAEEVFKSQTKALRWLTKPRRSLGGNSALEAACTTPGYLAAESLLEQLRHGFIA